MPQKIKPGVTVFVEPLDLETNAVLAENLAPDCFGEITCPDGVARQMWGWCGEQLLEALISARGTLDLKFNVWQRRGVKGELKRCSPEDIGLPSPVSA